jgi:hypothetical protein
MPPFLCAPPSIVDSTVKRDVEDLLRAATALGRLVEVVEADQARLVLTSVLRDMVESFAFEPWEHHALLQEMYRLLAQWFLQAPEGTVTLNLSAVTGQRPHPLPPGCSGDGLAQIWADELGRLLVVHDECCLKSEKFFVGIACVHGFAGEETRSYASEERAFPLVGPDELSRTLSDGYEWALDPDAWRQPITFKAAKQNVRLLGATSVEKPKRGSHYKVKFAGARSWPLDSNHTEIPERYIRQLVQITGLPLEVIWQTLVSGAQPKQRPRLHRWII